jgi:hypothetical protein
MDKSIPGVPVGPFVEDNFDEHGVQVRSELDAQGRELPDPVPFAPDAGLRSGDDLMAMIRRVVREENARYRDEVDQQVETFEEADDFEFDDNDEFGENPNELRFDPPSNVPSGAQVGQAGGATPPPATPPATPVAAPPVPVTSELPKPAEGPSNLGAATSPSRDRP